MKFFWQCALAFFGMVALDVSFALYIVATAAQQVFTASAWAAAIQLCNVVVVVGYVQDRRLAIPTVAGAFVGTWLALTYL